MFFWIFLFVVTSLLAITVFLYALAKIACESDLEAGYDEEAWQYEYSDEFIDDHEFDEEE